MTYRAYSFSLSLDQTKSAKAWISGHDCPIRQAYHGTLGGTIHFEFLLTTLATLISVHCTCGGELLLGEVGT